MTIVVRFKCVAGTTSHLIWHFAAHTCMLCALLQTELIKQHATVWDAYPYCIRIPTGFVLVVRYSWVVLYRYFSFSVSISFQLVNNCTI